MYSLRSDQTFKKNTGLGLAGYRLDNLLKCLIFVLSISALSACQSSSVVVNSMESSVEEAVLEPSFETVGKGSKTIGLITVLAGKNDAAQRDYRDGAKLAAEILGGETVSLSVYHGNGSAESIQIALSHFSNQNPALVIGTDGSYSSAVANISSDKRPIVVALAPNSMPKSSGVYPFVTDVYDSTIEAAGFAVAAGAKTMVIVHPVGLSSTEQARLRNGIEKKGGRVVGIFASSPDLVAAITKALKGKGEAEALVLAPSLEKPAAVVAALQASGAVASKTILIGNPSMAAEPSLADMIICRVDQAAVGDLQERYRSTFGRTMSTQAAYGFDAVALGVGLSRANSKVKEAMLKSRKGFTGLLGSFRFGADGSIERQCSIYTVADGKYALVDPAPNGF